MDIILSFSAVLITFQWDGNGWVKILQQILSGMTAGWKSLHVFLFLLFHLHFHSPLGKQSNNWKLTALNRSPFFIHCFDICSRCSLVPWKGVGQTSLPTYHITSSVLQTQWLEGISITSCGLGWDIAWNTHLLHRYAAVILSNNTFWQPRCWGS